MDSWRVLNHGHDSSVSSVSAAREEGTRKGRQFRSICGRKGERNNVREKHAVCWPRVHVGGEPVVPQGPKQLPLLAGAARTILPILQWEKKGFASGFKLFNFLQWNKDKKEPARPAVSLTEDSIDVAPAWNVK